MTAANQLFIQGLPFTSANDGTQSTGSFNGNRMAYGVGSAMWTSVVKPNTSIIEFVVITGGDSNGTTMKVDRVLSITADIYTSITYFV